MALNSGRRVYRKGMGSRKKRSKTVVNSFLIVIGLAVAVFLGISIAGPIREYFRNREIGGAADPWVPPALPDIIAADSNSGGNTGGGNGGNNSGSPSERAERGFSACQIPVSAMTNSDTLKDALIQARTDGYTAAVVTLKDKGGAIYYSTASEMALLADNAVKSDLTAEHICALIVAAGLKPIASVNLLEDHNIYGAGRQGAFKFENSISTWFDNRVDMGGKPWLSPFDTDTQDYAAFLADEVSKAGFETLIFDGLVFPPFRSSDLNYIGSIVKNESRYQALVNLALLAADAAASNGAASMLHISAADIITGGSEIFKPDSLEGATALIYYAPESFVKTFVDGNQEIVLSDMNISDSTTVVFNVISQKAGDKLALIPHVDSTGMNQEDFSDAITSLIALGYDSYVIS
ncbi:MAG: putative glycoside hydrolase [Oscillospiraceae bacterium]|nr:putative glycoside hydrolase [Oscillospiraceae bacterium]